VYWERREVCNTPRVLRSLLAGVGFALGGIDDKIQQSPNGVELVSSVSMTRYITYVLSHLNSRRVGERAPKHSNRGW
jgi:hypothetical protein